METKPNYLTLSFLDDDNLRALLNYALKERLDEALAQNEVQKEQIAILKNSYANKALELDKVKEENEQLYKELEEARGEGNSEPPFIVSASRMHLKDKKGKHPSKEWVNSYWLNMNDLANATTKTGNLLIENASHLGLVYKVITEDNDLAYNYCGTREDFATEWNDNVAERQDNLRKLKLSCKSTSLTATLNKPAYKNVSACSWGNLINDGDPNANLYAKGDKIKDIIHSFS